MSTSQQQEAASQRAQTPQARSLRTVDEVTISLVAPVSISKIERWVKGQIDRLRDQASPCEVRLGHLSPAPQGHDADWLVEVDLRARTVPLEEDIALASILLDLQLLGLQPKLLVPSPWGI
jgi:hypothetical protein